MLLKLNSYEGRLLRQSQQLLGQFFALRKARATDFSLEANPTSADDEIGATSEVLSPSEVLRKRRVKLVGTERAIRKRRLLVGGSLIGHAESG
jgi:hypothetical protein